MRETLRRLRERDQRGLTMVELLITMSLMGVVMAMAGAGLINMSKAAKTNQDRSESNAAIRLALERIARDVRAANPIDVQTPVSLYDSQIKFSVFCNPATSADCPASGLRLVTYRVLNNALEYSYNGGAFRSLLKPDAATGPLTSRQFAVVNVAAEPVFTYLKSNLAPLITQGTDAALPEKFRDCAQTIRIRLRVITENGNTRTPAELRTVVALRNFNEVSNCLP
ncbi:MAG TPA: type II secretion system protein [Acidimicrobiales bacterium]|nr:type II secretion system protein [Acidimicrobiales bacterium]